MPWEVVTTHEFEVWYEGLTDEPAWAIAAAIELIERDGPAVKRPVVGEITGSRFKNMKEICVAAEDHEIRILFIFDPVRRAVLLLGGDKTGQWNRWYRTAIPAADALYEQWLRDLEKG
jgi:hypothetical protein